AVPANVPGGIIRPGAVVGTAHWVSAVHYLKYNFTSRLVGIFRFGTFDDVDGQRTGFVGVTNHAALGANFYCTKDVIVRPEIRYDYNTNGQVFEGHHSLFTAGAGIVVR